jgi:hypothetical protein
MEFVILVKELKLFVDVGRIFTAAQLAGMLVQYLPRRNSPVCYLIYCDVTNLGR